MILDVNQTAQDMFAAGFHILRGGAPVGEAAMRGSIWTREGKWTASFLHHSFSMWRVSRASRPDAPKGYRPYAVALGGAEDGFICQTGGMGLSAGRDAYTRLTLGNLEYEEYPINFGREGAKCPVHRDGEQVALIEKDAVVYDARHNYRIYALSEAAALAGIMIVCYMYVIACYEPGVKVKKSVSKSIRIERGPGFSDKYDEGFKSRVSV